MKGMTEKEIIEDYNVRLKAVQSFNADNESFLKSLEHVWFRKEDIIKMIREAQDINEEIYLDSDNLQDCATKADYEGFNTACEQFLEEFNSPPISERDCNVTKSDDCSVKKTGEDANRSLHTANNCVVAPEGSTPSASVEDIFFTEQFPELKNSLTLRRFDDYSAYLMSEEDSRWDSFAYKEVVPSDDVEKFCLSKQRVKEAVMRLPDNNRRYILLKELNLE